MLFWLCRSARTFCVAKASTMALYCSMIYLQTVLCVSRTWLRSISQTSSGSRVRIIRRKVSSSCLALALFALYWRLLR